ncbi:MAG: NifB/NifX family molybdenum-iron cluster-binding protein [Peptococcaceae bacterium]|nr:NifB/NifX family molybdenum-iron cluster-binding protein [Peptococcaceae bacterium]
MKRIAVACEGEQVAQHFGHCANFMFFNTEGMELVNAESVPNPGHKPGFLPNFLADNGAEVVLAGGMGAGAIDIFNQRNVEVVTGAEGLAEDAVKAYLRGELKSNGAVCHAHEHHDECGGH